MRRANSLRPLEVFSVAFALTLPLWCAPAPLDAQPPASPQSENTQPIGGQTSEGQSSEGQSSEGQSSEAAQAAGTSERREGAEAERAAPGRAAGGVLPRVGAELPEVHLLDESGQPFSTGQFRGKHTVLVFGCLT